MADEARAMLDALMGADRNTHIPSSEGGGDGSSGRNKRGRSCYDKDVCPLYCAWGVDLFELFKNTKSDLQTTNPYIVDEDAREEYVSLPEHEKERLGYDFMLYRKLSDLVRGCNRIVDRNKEKLKAEIAKNARQRAEGKNEALVMDISQYVDSDQLLQCAQNIAALELYEEQVATLSTELQSLQSQEQALEARLLQPTNNDHENNNSNNNNNNNNNNNTNNSCLNNQDPLEIKKDLQALAKQQQTILTQISQLIADHIHPLRDTTQNQKRQLYYVRSDTTSDKTVCEVSGNFMSSRDADERIAAHYAGKQYVGWKLVREKCQQLSRKYGKLNHPPRYGAGAANYGRDHHRAPPPPPHPYGGSYHPPRSEYHHRSGSSSRRDRSRSRDRDDGRYYRRRSPSPARWERDRGPTRGYDQHRGHSSHHRSGGSSSHHHRKRSGGRDRRR